MLDKILRFLNEREKWVQYGKPVRSNERVEELFAICKGCEHFKPGLINEDKGSCKICGCGLKKEGQLLNKLSWATTHCPDNPPQWEEEPNLVLIELTEQQKKEFTQAAVEEKHNQQSTQQRNAAWALMTDDEKAALFPNMPEERKIEKFPNYTKSSDPNDHKVSFTFSELDEGQQKVTKHHYEKQPEPTNTCSKCGKKKQS